MQTRFNGNVVPFADDATSTNRTVFGGTTVSDDINLNLNADFKKGWEIVGLNDNPTREDFNAMGYTLGALIAYLYEMGIAEWNASQNYRINSRVIGSDGKVYKALTGTTGTPNVNHNPTTDTTNWKYELLDLSDYSTLTSKTTPVDADLLAIGDSASSFSLKKITWANLKATLLTYFDTLYTRTTAIIGVGQTWQDVTASRVAGTTYTNSSGKPIEIIISIAITNTVNDKFFNINGTPAGIIGGSTTTGSDIWTFIVPNGATYLLGGSNYNISKWMELR